MIDNKTLRSAFSKFTTGITVVTTTDQKGAMFGVTVNSFSSLSLDPPLVLWSLGDATCALDSFLKADAFVINVLSNNQQQVSDNFAAADEFDKFKSVSYTLSDQGIPLLDGCLARFHCRKYRLDRVGDHWLFLGELYHIEENKGEPLIFYNSCYRCLAEE